MKQQFTGTYTFTPSTGVVTLNSIDLPLERLYLIVNTTRNTPLFNFAVSGLGATRTFDSVNTTFQVAFDTSSHSSTDRLAIIYDDGVLESNGLLPKNTGPISESQRVIQVAGGFASSSGSATQYRPIKVDSDGRVEAVVTGEDLEVIAGRLPAQVNSRVPVEVGNFPATQPVSVDQTVSIFGEKFKTLANWSWPVSGHSPTLTVGGLEGRILRITGDWNGDGAPKTYRVVRVAAPNTNIVNVEVQQWATGVVIPAGTGTGAGDFYFRVPSELDAHRQLQLLKVSGDDLGTARATVSLYEESDTLNQGYSAVMSRPLTDGQLRATPVPVSGTVTANVTFPSNQAVTGPLTDAQLRTTPVPVSGTVTANVTFPETQPVSGTVTVNCRDGSGNSLGSATSDPGVLDRGLIVRNIPSGTQTVQSSSTSALSVKLTNSANNQVVGTRTANGGAENDLCLMVKNVNMIRLSGDTFVEERRPDICVSAEWENLANNGTATIYTRLNSTRRIRVNQIIFSWMYVGSATVNLFGQFVFQYFNESQTFAGDILKVRLQSGQMHTLTFPNGILSPSTGGSVRVVNQSGGGNINTNFNISLWEE